MNGFHLVVEKLGEHPKGGNGCDQRKFWKLLESLVGHGSSQLHV